MNPQAGPSLAVELLDEPGWDGRPVLITAWGDRLVLGRGTGRRYDVDLPAVTGTRGCFHLVRTAGRICLEIEPGDIEVRLGGQPMAPSAQVIFGDVLTFGTPASPFRVSVVAPKRAPVVRVAERRQAGPVPGQGPIRVHRRRPMDRLVDVLVPRGSRWDPRRWARAAWTRVRSPRTWQGAWKRLRDGGPRRALPWLVAIVGIGTLLGVQRRQAQQLEGVRAERDAERSERERWQAELARGPGEVATPIEVATLARLRRPELGQDPYYLPEAGFIQAVAAQYQQARDSSWYRWLVTEGRGADLVRLAAPVFGDLPEIFRYHALVESAACPFALSSTGARGPWQFTNGTALTLGLRVDPQRRDPAWIAAERVRVAAGGPGPDYAACDLARYRGSTAPAPGAWWSEPIDPDDERTDVTLATRAAADYHRRIWGRTEIQAIPDRGERIWFVLAGWNCGPESVKDGLEQLSRGGFRRTFWNLWEHDRRGTVRVRCDADQNLNHVPRVVGWYLAAKVARGEWPEAG